VEGQQPVIHLVCGAVGAGKTTYSRKLAHDRQALHLSIDEWMTNLFAPDVQDLPDVAWMVERFERCEVQMWELCKQLVAQHKEVVLDLGFIKQSQRDKFRRLAKEAEIPTLLHYLYASEQTRRQRVNKRNQDKNGTYSFEVTEFMFNFIEGWMEPPTDEELAGAIVINTEHPGN
jgi:predicted kinase